MRRIIAIALSMPLLMFSASAIAQPANTPATQVQPTQVNKRELIAVAARATQNKNYQLALQVANNVTRLFPEYGTGYLYKAITLYKLGNLEAAWLEFTTAKELYLSQLKSADVKAQEVKEARVLLDVVELHLKLLKTTKL